MQVPEALRAALRPLPAAASLLLKVVDSAGDKLTPHAIEQIAGKLKTLREELQNGGTATAVSILKHAQGSRALLVILSTALRAAEPRALQDGACTADTPVKQALRTLASTAAGVVGLVFELLAPVGGPGQLPPEVWPFATALMQMHTLQCCSRHLASAISDAEALKSAPAAPMNMSPVPKALWPGSSGGSDVRTASGKADAEGHVASGLDASTDTVGGPPGEGVAGSASAAADSAVVSQESEASCSAGADAAEPLAAAGATEAITAGEEAATSMAAAACAAPAAADAAATPLIATSEAGPLLVTAAPAVAATEGAEATILAATEGTGEGPGAMAEAVVAPAMEGPATSAEGEAATLPAAEGPTDGPSTSPAATSEAPAAAPAPAGAAATPAAAEPDATLNPAPQQPAVARAVDAKASPSAAHAPTPEELAAQRMASAQGLTQAVLSPLRLLALRVFGIMAEAGCRGICGVPAWCQPWRAFLFTLAVSLSRSHVLEHYARSLLLTLPPAPAAADTTAGADTMAGAAAAAAATCREGSSAGPSASAAAASDAWEHALLIKVCIDLMMLCRECNALCHPMAHLRAALSGRCARHLLLSLSLSVLCCADGGPDYGLPPGLCAALLPAAPTMATAECRTAGGVRGGGRAWAPTSQQLTTDAMHVLYAAVRALAEGDFAPVPPPPAPRDALHIVLRVGRLVVTSARFWAAPEAAARPRSAQPQRLGAPATALDSGAGPGGGADAVVWKRPPAVLQKPHSGSLGVVAASCALQLGRRVRRAAASAAAGAAAGSNTAAATAAACAVLEAPFRAEVATWRLAIGVMEHAVVCTRPESLGPLAEAMLLLDQDPLPGALPRVPPPSLIAALAAGLMPRLERLLRHAARDPSGPGAASLGVLCEEWSEAPFRFLALLLAFGDPAQAAALTATLTKLGLRAIAADGSLACVTGAGAFGPNHNNMMALHALGVGLMEQFPAWVAALPPPAEPGRPPPETWPPLQLAPLVWRYAVRTLPLLARRAEFTRRQAARPLPRNGAADAAAGAATAAAALMASYGGFGHPVICWLPLLVRVLRQLDSPAAAAAVALAGSWALSGVADATAAAAAKAAAAAAVDAATAAAAAAFWASDTATAMVSSLTSQAAVRYRRLLLQELNAVEMLACLLRSLPALRMSAKWHPGHARVLCRACAALAVAFPREVRQRMLRDAPTEAEAGDGCRPMHAWHPFWLRLLVPDLRAGGYLAEAAGMEALAARLERWCAGEPVREPVPERAPGGGDGSGGGGSVEQDLIEQAAFGDISDTACWTLAVAAIKAACEEQEQQDSGGGGGSACANPRCANLDGDSEAELRLQACAGCKEVGYCCADCREVHWRAGHKDVCSRRRLAVAAGAAAAALADAGASAAAADGGTPGAATMVGAVSGPARGGRSEAEAQAGERRCIRAPAGPEGDGMQGWGQALRMLLCILGTLILLWLRRGPEAVEQAIDM